MSIKSRLAQQRNGYISKACKVFMKCQETSGKHAYATVGQYRYDPLITTTDPVALAFFGPPNGDGFVSFDTPNAVRIQNDDSKLPTDIKIDQIEFDARKVILIAATVINRETAPGDGNQTRVAFGTAGYGNVLSNSIQLSMHLSLTIASLEDGSDAETVSLRSVDLPGGAMSPPADTLGIVYLLWDGPTGTLSGKLLNIDGTVFNDGAQNFELSITQPLTNGQTLFNIPNMGRLSNGDYYSVVAAQYDKIPKDLDVKLGQWGEESVKGNKGFPDF